MNLLTTLRVYAKSGLQHTIKYMTLSAALAYETLSIYAFCRKCLLWGKDMRFHLKRSNYLRGVTQVLIKPWTTLSFTDVGFFAYPIIPHSNKAQDVHLTLPHADIFSIHTSHQGNHTPSRSSTTSGRRVIMDPPSHEYLTELPSSSGGPPLSSFFYSPLLRDSSCASTRLPSGHDSDTTSWEDITYKTNSTHF